MGRSICCMTAISIWALYNVALGIKLCPDGYQRYINRCYRNITVQEPGDSSTAQALCGQDETLPIPVDEAAFLFLKEFLSNLTDSGFVFIGLTDEKKEGTFIWQNGYFESTFGYNITEVISDKDGSTLKDSNTAENDCVTLNGFGELSMISCQDTVELVICQRKMQLGERCGLKGERVLFD